MSKHDWLAITLDDLKTLAKVADVNLKVVPSEDGEPLPTEANPLGNRIMGSNLLKDLALCALKGEPKEFAYMVDVNMGRLREMAIFEDFVSDVLIEGLKLGVSQKCGESACTLGAFYYDGDFVDQDFEKAAELYELGMEWGNIQATINLGYIYEYGRTGPHDYAKAFECYSTAAALVQASEALYKMGDLFSRGKGVEQNRRLAVRLWERSLARATSDALKAQASIRLAPLYLEGDSKVDIEQDALYALKLYQDAEIGLRQDIAKGLTYYQKRLEEAIDGQQKVREELERKRILRI